MPSWFIILDFTVYDVDIEGLDRVVYTSNFF